MNCSFIINDEPCGSESSTVYLNFAVCEEHLVVASNRDKRFRRSTSVQAAKHHPLDAFPGICYVILLPDATVKIGYSNTDELFKQRMQAIKREYKAPPVVLAKLPGGFVAEAVLHERFSEYRLPGNGERFTYSPEMAAYLASQGGF